MAATRQEILSSQVVNANGVSASQSVKTVTMLMLLLDVTAKTGTTPTLDMWLQGSDDGGTTWADLAADQVTKSADAAAENATSINKRDMELADETGQVTAIYKHLATDTIRLKWKLGGSASPSYTLSVSYIGK